MGVLFEEINHLEEEERVLKEAVSALRDCSSPDADLAQQRLDRAQAKRQ